MYNIETKLMAAEAKQNSWIYNVLATNIWCCNHWNMLSSIGDITKPIFGTFTIAKKSLNTISIKTNSKNPTKIK